MRGHSPPMLKDTAFPCEKRQLPTGMTLSTWLQSEEEGLRQDRYLRDKNALVAYSLLPIFESDPAGWNFIRRSTRFLSHAHGLPARMARKT